MLQSALAFEQIIKVNGLFMLLYLDFTNEVYLIS